MWADAIYALYIGGAVTFLYYFTGFLQLSQDQIPGVFKNFSRSHLPFSRSPILEKTCLYGVKKVYSIIGYDNKNLIVFDYCK